MSHRSVIRLQQAELDRAASATSPPETQPSSCYRWSGRVDSNHRPLDPQSSALTRLRYAPNRHPRLCRRQRAQRSRLAGFCKGRCWQPPRRLDPGGRCRYALKAEMGEVASRWTLVASTALHGAVIALTFARTPSAAAAEPMRADFWGGTTFEVPEVA